MNNLEKGLAYTTENAKGSWCILGAASGSLLISWLCLLFGFSCILRLVSLVVAKFSGPLHTHIIEPRAKELLCLGIFLQKSWRWFWMLCLELHVSLNQSRSIVEEIMTRLSQVPCIITSLETGGISFSQPHRNYRKRGKEGNPCISWSSLEKCLVRL